MGFEAPPPIPEENELPLKIRHSEPMAHQGRESAMWRVRVEDKNIEERAVALKRVRKEEFATDEELKKSKQFYDYLKSFPAFGKFVPDTLYFKAREKSGEAVHAYRLQKMVEGKRIDEMSDEELYANEDVLRQLLEFIKAASEVFKESQKREVSTPDLYGDKMLANYLFNPRYGSNIVITEKPDKSGQRLFFVDANPQVQQLKGIGKSFQRHVGSELQLKQLERWRKLVEDRLGRAEANNKEKHAT